MARRRIHCWQDSGTLEEMDKGRWSYSSIERSGVLYDDTLWDRYLAAEEAFLEARRAVVAALRSERPSEEEKRELSWLDNDDTGQSI